jgi:hypothetical protein
MFKSGGTKFGSFSGTSTTFAPEKTSYSTTTQVAKPTISKDSNHKVNSNDYVPKRFGLKFDPPSISIIIPCVILTLS